MSILIMSEVWKHAPADKGDLLILLALADHADDDGRCFPSISLLSAKGRMTERNAQRCLRALEEKGVLSTEQGAGPKGCNVYLIDVAAMRRIAAEERRTATEGDDKMSPPDADAGGDKIDAQGVTKSTGGGDVGVTRTVMEPSIEPSEREGARERENGQEEEKPADRSAQPGTADFEKRVMRFCNGKGFEAGPWPNWDTSSPGYIGRNFAALSEDDRRQAEAWRDAYLHDIKGRGLKPVVIGNFLRDRLWTGLDDGVMQRWQKRPVAGGHKPEGFAPAYGPLWSAILFRILVAGPDRKDLAPEGSFWLAQQMRTAWPKLFGFHQASSQKNGVVARDATDHRLAQMMAFVPVASAVMEEWRDEFKRRSWPELRVPDGMGGGYFPAGGPEGLDAFMDAVISNSEAAE